MSEGRGTLHFSFAGLFWVVVFVVLAATGNCGVCGLDHDYVQDWVEVRDEH